MVLRVLPGLENKVFLKELPGLVREVLLKVLPTLDSLDEVLLGMF